MKAFILGALTLAVGFSAQAARYEAGQDYFVLDNPEKITGNKIIVREFFWSGCPHCYHLEPHMAKWAKTKADDVAFFHTPAAMNPLWEKSARGFYATQLMGYQEKVHEPLFNAIHKQNQRLFDQNSLANFYSKFGVDKREFNKLYNSFAVQTKINRSRNAAMRYQLSGVPAVVVQGKYVVKGSDARVPQVVDYLVNKVRQEKK